MDLCASETVCIMKLKYLKKCIIIRYFHFDGLKKGLKKVGKDTNG